MQKTMMTKRSFAFDTTPLTDDFMQRIPRSTRWAIYELVPLMVPSELSKNSLRSFVTTAYFNGRPCGYHFFDVHAGLTLESTLTYVMQAHRGKGVGAMLWAWSLGRHSRVQRVRVVAVSNGGVGVMRKVQQLTAGWPRRIEFKVKDGRA